MATTRPRAIAVQVYTRYEARRVYARPQLVGERHVAAGGRLELELYSTRSGELQATRVVRDIGLEEVAFDTRGVAFGCCAFRATFIDRHGTRFHTDILQDKTPGRFDWMGSRAGLSRRVPAPFTPLKLTRRAGELSVSCWGRDYIFGGSSFLKAIVSEGRQLLAGPVVPVAEVDGKFLRWGRARWKLTAAGRDQVVIEARLRSAAGVLVDIRAEVDFDGMVRIDWAIAAARIVRLERLAIEWPLDAELARYFYHFPGSWGGVRNVGSLPQRDLNMGFRPFFWLGDEEKGLSWFAESNRDWLVRDAARTTQIVHADKSVVARVNIVTEPLTLVPGQQLGRSFTGHGDRAEALAPGLVTDVLRYTFGMQATPVKPVAEDAWEQRIVCINQGAAGFRPRLNVSNRALDNFVAAGVRTVVLFEHWTDAEGYTKTPHAAAVRKIVKACHDRGLKVLLYFSFLISEISDEWEAIGKDCVILPKGGYPVFHYQPQPDQAAWRVCLNSLWQDLLVDGIARVMDDYEVDGVYLDGTEYPFGCCNTEHGCGVVRADGSIAQSFPIFAARSTMRRIHQVVKARRRDGLINVHNSTCMTIPTLGWASSYWDGEQFQGVGEGVDVGSLLPLDAFRAEFMGHQWGVPAEFLLTGRAYTFEQAWSFSLLHDVPVRPGTDADQLDLTNSIWAAMDAFDRRRAEWLPYWRNSAWVRVRPRGCHVSLYRHPRRGVLAAIANLSGKQTCVTVRLELHELGLRPASTAVDALKKTAIPLRKGTAKIDLPNLGWRLIWIRN